MLDPELTYFVESREDPTVLLALHPRLEGGRIEWFDTVRDRSLGFESIEEEAEAVVVRSTTGTYRFVPLTLEIYRARVQARVTGKPEFMSTEALQRYYRRQPS